MKRFLLQPHIFALLAIILIGGFLRFYQFEPWLHFELDQSRDALVVDEGYKGSFLDLPLLGPRGGGTFLRLGPAFYYFQYVSGAVFGEDPAGIAFFVPILSVAAIFFVYLLFRRAFSRFESLSLTLLFAVSLYVVMYGRFAWNPNLLIFFMPAGLYALLRSLDKEDTKKGAWFLLAVALLTLATQFHFLALLALPPIVLIFLALKRPFFSWKIWAWAIALPIFLYSPMILNESKAGFTNTKEFFGAITEKSTKEDHNILEKAIRNDSEYALAGIVTLTGFEGAAIPSVIIERSGIETLCRDKCDDGKWYGIAGLIVFGLSFLTLIWVRVKTTIREEKDFYDLCLIWLGVSYLIFLPLSYGVAPRFYLLVTPLFFVLLGVLVKVVSKKFPATIRPLVFGGVIFLLVVSNIHFITQRFSELKRAKTEQVENEPDRILKEQIRVTLEQQKMITDFFKNRQQLTGYPIYMYSDPQYRRALKYVMEQAGVQNEVLGLSNIYREGEYYLVLRHRGDYEPAIRKYRESYEVGEYTSFGTLTMIQLIPKPERIIGERQDFSIPEKKSTSAEAPRYTWREFFQKKGTALEDDAEEGEEENN